MYLNGEKGIGNILKILLQIINIVLVFFLLSLYYIVNLIGIHFNLFIIMIYPCGLCFMFLVHCFIKMFDSLKTNKPFIYKNVLYMKKSMFTCFIISVLVIISLLIASCIYDYYSLQLKVALGFISILFFGVGIALYILSELFKEAILYKEENDLTI